ATLPTPSAAGGTPSPGPKTGGAGIAAPSGGGSVATSSAGRVASAPTIAGRAGAEPAIAAGGRAGATPAAGSGGMPLAGWGVTEGAGPAELPLEITNVDVTQNIKRRFGAPHVAVNPKDPNNIVVLASSNLGYTKACLPPPPGSDCEMIAAGGNLFLTQPRGF